MGVAAAAAAAARVAVGGAEGVEHVGFSLNECVTIEEWPGRQTDKSTPTSPPSPTLPLLPPGSSLPPSNTEKIISTEELNSILHSRGYQKII